MGHLSLNGQAGHFSLNPLNPIVHFWLDHTAHCAEKIVSARLRTGSVSAERVGEGEVGGVTGRVLCTWWLLGLALKRPLLVPGGQPHTLTAWTGLENTIYSHLAEGWFLARKAAWSLSGCMATDNADYYMLVNEWVWSKSRDSSLRPEVEMGAVLESELGQKWRYGVLKACVG